MANLTWVKLELIDGDVRYVPLSSWPINLTLGVDDDPERVERHYKRRSGEYPLRYWEVKP